MESKEIRDYLRNKIQRLQSDSLFCLSFLNSHFQPATTNHTRAFFNKKCGNVQSTRLILR
jgi:hypothetical protein